MIEISRKRRRKKKCHEYFFFNKINETGKGNKLVIIKVIEINSQNRV